MKKIRNLAILLSIFIIVSSGGTVKEAFSTQKKNSNDEFLVEKKSPLILPPDFNELPEPKSQNSDEDNNQQQQNIKQLIQRSIQSNQFNPNTSYFI